MEITAKFESGYVPKRKKTIAKYKQTSIFDGTQDFRIDKPVRLIEMFGKDSTQAVNDYLKDIFGGENGGEQTPLSCELETNKSRAETRRKKIIVKNCEKTVDNGLNM